jgi:hypothetical protein
MSAAFYHRPDAVSRSESERETTAAATYYGML